MIRTSDGYTLYDSSTVYGPEAPQSFTFSGTPPKWHSNGAPDMGEELCKALEWVMSNG